MSTYSKWLVALLIFMAFVAVVGLALSPLPLSEPRRAWVVDSACVSYEIGQFLGSASSHVRCAVVVVDDAGQRETFKTDADYPLGSPVQVYDGAFGGIR